MLTPYNIIPKAHVKVTKIEGMIANSRGSRLTNKFSLSASLSSSSSYRELYGEYAYWWRGIIADEKKRKALVMRIAVIRWLGDVAVTGKDEWSNKPHFGIISMRCAINADILHTYDIDSCTNQSQSFCFHIVFIQFALNWPTPRQTGKFIRRYKILIVMWKIVCFFCKWDFL